MTKIFNDPKKLHFLQVPALPAAGRIRLAHGLIKTIDSLRYRRAWLDQPPILRRDGGRRRVRRRDVRGHVTRAGHAHVVCPPRHSHDGCPTNTRAGREPASARHRSRTGPSPQIVMKRQRRLSGIEEIVLSLTATAYLVS